MKFKFHNMALYLILYLLSACGVAASPKTHGATKMKTGAQSHQLAEGRWSVDCNRFEGLHVYIGEKSRFEINSNQIYVNIEIEYENSGKGNIFLASTYDLGRGGMMLPWHAFSNTKPIAQFEILSPSMVKIQWHGFFNVNNKQYQWAKNPDFYKKDSMIIFHKCSDDK